MDSVFHFSFFWALLLCSTVHVASSSSLKDKRLVCCTLEQFPVIYKDNSSTDGLFGLDGLAIRYLKQLQDKLGFQCTKMLVMSKHGVGFSSFVSSLEGCTNGTNINHEVYDCELATGGWMRTASRFGRVDFLPPFVRDDYRVVSRIDERDSPMEGPFFLSAFQPLVWLGVASLIVLFTGLKMIGSASTSFQETFEQMPPSVSWLPRGMISSFYAFWNQPLPKRLMHSAQSTLEWIVGQTDDSGAPENRNLTTWLLNFVILLCGLFLVLTYEAAMTANLVLGSNSDTDFRTIEDFKQCRINASQVCIPTGGAVEDYWNSNIAVMPCQETIGQGTIGPKPKYGYPEAVESLLNKECKFLFSDGMTALQATRRDGCNQLIATGKDTTSDGQAFILPHGSPYTDELSTATLNLIERNMLPTADRFLDDENSCSVPTQTTALGIENVKYFFILAYTSAIVLFFLMLLKTGEGRTGEGRTGEGQT